MCLQIIHAQKTNSFICFSNNFILVRVAADLETDLETGNSPGSEAFFSTDLITQYS